MTPRERIIEAIEHRETPKVPYNLRIDLHMKEELNAHFGDDSWENGIVNHTMSMSPFDTRKFVDLGDNRFRDMYGSVWRRDLRPSHQEEPGLKEPSFDNYRFPTLRDCVCEESEKACREVMENNKEKFITFGIGAGVFERTWFIRGFENALMDSVLHEDFFDELCERIFNLQMSLVKECLKYPIDGIAFSDDWGAQHGVILGPDRWRKFIKPRVAKMYQAVHDTGKYAISHCCGSVADILPDIIEIGLDALESVQPEARGMNPYELKRRYGDRITFWGGLGSQSTIPFGTPKDIKNEVRKLKTEMGKGGGYILSAAKPIQPGTPMENVLACIEAFTLN